MSPENQKENLKKVILYSSDDVIPVTTEGYTC